MLGTQPLTQPLASVIGHRSIGFADRTETEVVGPPNDHAVELRYHHLLVQQGLIPPGQLANRRADAVSLAISMSISETRAIRAPPGGGPTSFRAGSRHRPKLCQFFSSRSNRSSNENGAQELLASQPRCRAMESLIALVKLPCGQANTSRRGFGELLL